eukprot:TRINITY_DN18813_c0_g1_i1.p1 TRINITY_DN18813_c0_g1~~TRINITY_DN18813_c0_g1_i1.p1  ORF type:complete len:168 (-),score=22.93 TRINITY_DN18813_c0_g1_i1:307-810(-)
MRGGYLLSIACLFPSILLNTIETACSWTDFPALHSAVLQAARAAILSKCGVEGQVTCRFTHVYPDGPAPYYTIYVKGIEVTQADSNTEDPRLAMWSAIKASVMDAILAHGGTSTHHHSVGRLHLPSYIKERGKLWGATLAAAKSVHDPTGIMNPGLLGTTKLGTSRL